MECKTWRREVRDLAAPIRLENIEWQVDHQLCIVTLRSIVRVASWIVGEMRKERLLSGTVIIVGRILKWGILHAVVLRVANRLYMISRTW